MDYAIMGQLKAGNNLAKWKYLTTGSYTFTTSTTGAAYRIVGLRNWRVKSMTNALCLNATAMTSADTLTIGTEITGKITAITIVAGRAAAYLAREALFVS